MYIDILSMIHLFLYNYNIFVYFDLNQCTEWWEFHADVKCHLVRISRKITSEEKLEVAVELLTTISKTTFDEKWPLKEVKDKSFTT